MSHPVPRDPRQLAVNSEDLDRAIEDILAQPAEDPITEAQQLDRAHELLREALQEN